MYPKKRSYIRPSAQRGLMGDWRDLSGSGRFDQPQYGWLWPYKLEIVDFTIFIVICTVDLTLKNSKTQPFMPVRSQSTVSSLSVQKHLRR